MSRNGMKPNWTSWRLLAGALALACGLPLVARGDWGDTDFWKSGSANGNWDNTFWYNTTRSWDNHNPGYIGGQDLRFDNDSNTAMTNNWTSSSPNGTNMWRITFTNAATASRTIAGTTQNTFRNNGTPKIENFISAGHTLSFPFRLETTMQINPISGNLTVNGNIDNNGQWIEVWGSNQKTLNLGGVLSGSGGLAVKQDSIVSLTNNNTFTGVIWIEKGTVQANTHSNAIGLSGVMNVGTNATLDLQYGATTSMPPTTLNLYGTGTNASWGALRKTTAGALTWRGVVSNWADARIVTTAGGFTFTTNIVNNANTLYITNTVTVQMTGGEMTGNKTTGDGALHKTGSGTLTIRPGSGLTGSILLYQGEIRQDTVTANLLPSGGTMVMSNGTTYSSADNNAAMKTNAKAIQIAGDVTLGSSTASLNGSLNFTGNMDLSAAQRQLTIPNTNTISGAIANGGLTKAGAGTLILSGANTYSAGTLISAGILQIGSNGTSGSVSANITNNSALVFNRSDSITYAGALTGTGVLTNLAGVLTLTGASTLSGNTVITGGTLIQNGTNTASAVSVASGAFLYGTGSNGAMTITGQASAGNGSNTVGNLKVTDLTLPGNGRMQVNISAMTGTAGTDWDVITVSNGTVGTYTVSSGIGTEFVLALKGSPAVDPSLSYTLTIVDAGTASGFAATKFTINTNELTATLGSGTFSVTNTSGDLKLVFTPGIPSAPTGLNASDGASAAHISNSWTDVAGETGYVIWRYTNSTFASSTAIYTNGAGVTNYVDTSVTPGLLYYYWVTATNSAGSSAASSADSGYRKLATVSITGGTDGTDTNKVSLTWTDITGETGYSVWRYTADTSGSATWVTNTAAGATSADDTTATPGQKYYYWVRATNDTSFSQSDFQASGEPAYRKLATVTGVAASDNLSDKVTVTWSDITGETGYNIWRHTADVPGSASIVGTATVNAVTYDDTTAVAGTAYFYWVRATNNTSASMGDFSASDAGLRLLTEPTTAATNITFSSVMSNAMTVGWTRGTAPGDYVLVVAQQGSAPTDPSDGTAYTANAAFGSGDTTAAGSYVVYKGVGTSVPVTGLAVTTEYYFAVYEFNGTTSPNYRTSDEPVSNRFTVATEPTTQATSIVIGGTNEVSLTGINWTDGNGLSRLVVVKAGGAVDSFPVDGTGYTANAAFGSGTQIGTGNYVVFAGSGPLATLSGLSRDVVYYIRVFEFNGSNTTANYFTNSAAGNPTSQTTMAANPGSAATNLIITSIGTNQFTLSWTNGTTGTNTLILVKAGGISTDPADLTTYTANTAFGSGTAIDSGYVVYTNTGTNVTVTGLAPGTRYYVKAYAFNGAPGAQNYRTSDPASTNGYTLMGEPSQATSIAFSTLADTSYAVSFTAGSGLTRLVVAKQGSAVTFLPTDATAYAGENNNFGAGTDLGSGNILVHRGTSPFTLSGLSAATEYYIRIFEYQGTNATLNYNTNAASSNPSNRYTLSTEPSAHAASLTATALNETNISLSWGAGAGESGYIIVRKSGSAPTGTPADGTAYAQGDAIGDGTVVYVNTAAGAGATTDGYSTVASTAYYYQIFPYKYDGTVAHATYNYRTSATIPGANATTGPAEPGTSSTLLSFLPASSTSATITWTNSGSADGSILLVKSNSAVSSNPSDWTNYTANTTFQSGSQIGSGNYVVYAAAGKTGIVTVAGLYAGSTYHVAVYPYNGAGSFLNYRTNSPATNSLTILPDPTAQSATADGKTMVRLAWTKNASYDVMIVYRAGSASTVPTQGQAYNVGDACGSGTVIYTGSVATLEHVVASGTTHYYAFYSKNGNYYSAGATDSEPTTSFAAAEIVDTFSYTNSTALTGLNGSNGWGGAWYGDTTLFTNSSGSFTTQTNYPATSGNKLFVSPVNDANLAVYRPLAQSYNSGRIYFGYILNYQNSGSEKYEGLSFYNTNTSERLFFGEIGGADQQLGIDSTGSGYTLTAGGGNDYIIVGYYDWGTAEAKAKAFKIGTAAVPTDEPASWDVTVSKASNSVGTVNNIRFAAGEYGAGSGTPGNCYFDEVRISTNWAGLLGVVPSKPAAPTNQTATADGNEMVRLAWTTNAAGNGVIILHKTSAIATDPSDGVSYTAGNTIDGATVIYKGSASKLEHVVDAGSSDYYKIYSYNGSDFYSTGVAANVAMGSYASYENVNPFSYTNGTTLGSSSKGGQGFGANFWTVDSGTWTAQTNYTTAVADQTPKFVNMSNYPSMAGNLVVASDPGSGGSAKAQRSLSSAINSGTIYIAFMMSYQYRGADKWAGISFFNGATEKAFFGKGAGGDWSTLGIGDGTTTYWSSFDMGEFYSGTGNTGNFYMVIGKYEFGTKLLAAKAYRILDGTAFPESEPSWDVSTTLGTGIDSIDRIKLNVGSTDGGNTIGKVFFDEIRYATNWSSLIVATCPTWAGSNTLSNTNTYLGDTESFQFQSSPTGLGQSGNIEFDWAKTGAFSTTNAMTWWKNVGTNSYWTNLVQMTTAGSITSRFAAVGNACGAVRTNNAKIVVSNLTAPSAATATRDGVNTNSQINLTWTRGVSGSAKDTIIVRRAGSAPDAGPVNGSTYNAGDALGSGTVVYRGSGTNFNDTGLAPSTTYYYWFYAENYTYYSSSHDTANASTAAGGQTIVIDGNFADWLGSPSTVLDSSASSLQEFIWTDKKGETRVDNGDYPNADITEFRVFADATNVYFLIKMTNITDVTKPFVAIGVDTRTNSGSTAMNWLGDDSGTYIGDGYAQGAAAHYPEYQLNIHYVSADSAPRIEVFTQGGSIWDAPLTGGNTNVVISTVYKAIELKVPRADLNLTGAKTARFTAASFLNTASWNNIGDGTVQLAANTADAVDAISIPPWNTEDDSANLSAWLEDLSDADIDFWMDVQFGASSLTGNSRPSTPALVTPTNNANTTASPNLSWQPSTDSDGQITGYLLEMSTNEQFNGASGTENGTVDLRVNLNASTTNYAFTTSTTQYWWRVRARDTAGELSSATTRLFRVVGKLDTEGPQPTLLYIGTNVAGYLAGAYDAEIAAHGPIQSVLDREIRDTNNVFGFVIRWEDPSYVYATNKMKSADSPPNGAGGFAWNIVSTDGRVSPNWDLFETNTVTHATREWGKDAVFYATNTRATGNADVTITNYVHAAFTMTNYDSAIEYYLTLSAEDGYSDGGSWASYGSWNSFTSSASLTYSGWCDDGPSTVRNVTTNTLIRIVVTDDDIIAPEASTSLAWDDTASLVVSNATGRLEYVSGTGQDVLYQATDGGILGNPLAFSFNAYDSYYKGIALGTSTTYSASGNTLTNTAFVAVNWQTNWANFNAPRSATSDTVNANTMITWYWASMTTQDVTALWGPDSLSGAMGTTNLIQLNLYDVDNNRSGDQSAALVNFGRVRLVDDDSDDPVVTNLAVSGTGLASEYQLANLVVWDFPDTGDSRLTSTNVTTGVTASAISLDSGAIGGSTNISVSAGFNRTNTPSRSWLFSLAPTATDKTFKVTSLSFDSKVSNANGPDTLELWGVTNGVTSLWATISLDMADPDNAGGTNWNGYSASVAMPAAATNTVNFLLKAYVSDTNRLTDFAGTETWTVDNLILSGYVLGQAGGVQLTDHDLAQGTARFQASLMDTNSGIYAATGLGRAPRVDFWYGAGTPVTNSFFTNNLASNGAAKSATTVWGYAPVADRKQIQGGSVPTNYTARFTADDYDVDRDSDWRSVSSSTNTVAVYDEDTNAPVRGYKYGGPLGVYVDGTITRAISSGFTREYRINDEQLQTAAATSITVKVNLYDYSGWTVPTLSFSNAQDGVVSTNGWLTPLVTTSVNTTNNPDAEMVWTFDKSQATNLFITRESTVNTFRVLSSWDKDDDRQNAGGTNIDGIELANARLGDVTFIDNDVGQPNVQSNWSVARTNWNIPKIYLGLPGDAAHSNLLISSMGDTNSGAVLANLTNRIYDSQLATVSTSAPLSVVLPIFDTGGGGSGRTVKGVKRGTALTESSEAGGTHNVSNTWISVGTVQVQNASAYRSDLSSSLALTKISAQFPTSTWAFTSFNYDAVGTWLPTGAVSSNQALSTGLFDADDNRPSDQKYRLVSFGTLQVLDNDTVAPSLPTNLTVNGQAQAGAFTLDRNTASWTNTPNFQISFKPGADGEPAATDLEKTGVGEHRVATSKSDIGPDLGTPLAVAAEGALANSGFENGSTNWTLIGALVTTNQAYEGRYSLQATNSSAQQTVSLMNTNGYAPHVTLQSVHYMGSITGTVTVAGLTTNGTTNSSFQISIVGTNGQWVVGSSAEQTLGAPVDRVQVTLNGVGYWDGVQVKIELWNGGAPVEEANVLFTATVQGLTTNYLFAVDRDNNRPGDRKASSAPADSYIPAFGIAYDITPPTAVTNLRASSDTADDPTTQFGLSWSTANVGPDKTNHVNYPVGYSGNDILSPWKSYKVYYATYDPLQVRGDDPGRNNASAFIYTNFIANGAYTNWASVSSTNTIADPSAGTNYLALTNLSRSSIRLCDLDYDQEYAVVIVGVDKAGNEGEATPASWDTNNTIRFAVTQGLLRARSAVESAFPGNNNLRPGDHSAAALYWLAAGSTNSQGQYTQVTRDYDLIYLDSASYNESSNYTWSKVGTVRTNWFTDAPGQDLAPRGNMRFYRASYSNRWQRTNPATGQPQRPLASEDVYAMHNILLAEGYNFVGLHGQPYTNSFLGVFGNDTNIWPSGASAANATRIEFYSAGVSAPVSDVYFFGNDANWYTTTNGVPVTTNLQSASFFTRGFSITLPSPLPAQYATTNALDINSGSNILAMVWHPVLKVPTNGPSSGNFSQVISTGARDGRGHFTNVYNVVALNLPVAVHPNQMNLTGSGFVNGAFGLSDEIYTWDTANKRTRDGNKIYCDASGTWRFGTGGGLVPAGYFKPNDVIIIVSRNGGIGNSWTWTYNPTNFYSLPTRWMGQ